jgi:hypothetical protein
VIGSDGLVYQIVPSVSSGAGLPISNNLDSSQSYTQPQPSYATGNADGLTGNLEPYDRPGKTNLFRTYAFFLQPTQENANGFWNSVIDLTWLANSPDADAAALRSAQGNASIPWRLMYHYLLRAVLAAGLDRIDGHTADHPDHGRAGGSMRHRTSSFWRRPPRRRGPRTIRQTTSRPRG